MNRWIGIGRLTDEPKINRNGNTPNAKYTLAVDRLGEGTDFISCVTFGKGADFAESYLHKGMKIAVDGRIQTGSYTNKDGVKIYTTDVVVDRHEFCESKGGNFSQTTNNVTQATDNVTMNELQEELPFK